MAVFLVSIVFPHHVFVFESRRKNIDRVNLKLLFKMKALKEGVRLLFGSIEGEHISYRDDEVGNDEGAPEADKHTCEPAQERFREEVTIAHGRQGHYYAPHSIAKLVEVLLRRHRHGTFEYLEGITEKQDGDCQRYEN